MTTMTTLTAPRAAARSSRWTGLGTLVRLNLRRDRVLIPASAIALGASAYTAAKATYELYPSDALVVEAARSVYASPAVKTLYGTLEEPINRDAVAAYKLVLLGALLTALVATIVVRRHTRTDEEDGRTELLGAEPIDRATPLVAAIIAGIVAVFACALVGALGMIGAGAQAGGSFAMGLTWTVAGLSFIGITAVVSQLVSTSRMVGIIAFTILGITYLMRSMADASGPAALNALTPFGWAASVHPWSSNRLWPLAPALATLGIGYAAALSLFGRRDLGAGIFPARPGRAGGRLHTPEGLAWRLGRPTVLAGLVTFTGLGVVVGTLANSAETLVTDAATKDMLTKMAGGSGALRELFIGEEFAFSGVIAAAFGIAIVLRLRSEESSGRAELLLAAPLSRARWALSHVTVALVGSALILLAAGVAAALTGRGGNGPVPTFAAITNAALVGVPGAWVCIGGAALIVALFPRYFGLAWGILGYLMVITLIKGLVDLPAFVTWLNPFGHLSSIPGRDISLGTVAALIAVAAALMTAAISALNRRDIQP